LVMLVVEKKKRKREEKKKDANSEGAFPGGNVIVLRRGLGSRGSSKGCEFKGAWYICPVPKRRKPSLPYMWI